MQACLQHDMKTTRGVLVMITLSPDCAIIASIKTAMNVIHREKPSVTARTLVVGHGEGLCARVPVDVLMVGL